MVLIDFVDIPVLADRIIHDLITSVKKLFAITIIKVVKLTCRLLANIITLHLFEGTSIATAPRIQQYLIEQLLTHCHALVCQSQLLIAIQLVAVAAI